ncbi:MAG: DUF3293 domain-containing protein [candidate division WOR-3 bacterium]|jgi:hypothetical protein|nr:DUF3293 domain-containing protein [candidate division WOR-3 bacterium]MDH7519447.1 DUF3293 domain-containing protein [bacterium]
MIVAHPDDFLGKMLLELALRRLSHQFKNGRFGIVSAFRDRPKKENLAAMAKLMDRVREMGYGYVPIKGYWDGVPERSLFIPDITKDDVAQLAKEFAPGAYIWGDKGQWVCYDTSTDREIGQGRSFDVLKIDTEVQSYFRYWVRKSALTELEHIIAKLQSREKKDDQIERTLAGYQRKRERLIQELKLMEKEFEDDAL